ncbi:hypothetical protein [Erwinia persicina]|uniref:Ferrous iron transport protein A n=1 Tax=Erwinia persicina TaxID=55211 RepID=A0ABR8ZMZ5_9GAMM|nr:hypothetical protein [Erwinia persicina]MBC3944002.1 hypothetical protein [Erwinia persicina]MBD8105034.1 hypothetical protein [Erwinia persicina]MBD8169361.1 hypothetical protein [Erwinia persicina]MBD8208180.1 hypothetical protein [Erwinia persicina]MCQ4092515.1 hypothetical protein [Erwinia persicina]
MTIQARQLTLNHQLRQFGMLVKLAMIRSTPQCIEVWTMSGNRLRFTPAQQIEALLVV